MSNAKIKIVERTTRLPEKGTVQLSEREAQAISELVNSQTFKVLATKLFPQLENLAARKAVTAIDDRALYYRGIYDNHLQLIGILEAIRDTYRKKDD